MSFGPVDYRFWNFAEKVESPAEMPAAFSGEAPFVAASVVHVRLANGRCCHRWNIARIHIVSINKMQLGGLPRLWQMLGIEGFAKVEIRETGAKNV